MIIAGILNILYFFITSILRLLPSTEILPSGFSTAFDFVQTVLAGIYDLVPPLATLSTIILLIMSFEIGLFAFWSIDWVINKVRGSG